MNVSSLKEYIYENNKIEYILETIGCHQIKCNDIKGYYSAAHKNGDNPSGVVIYNNKYLNYISYSRNVSIADKQDIIDLIQTDEKMDFLSAVKFIHKILNLQYTYSKPDQNKQTEKKESFFCYQRNIKSKRCSYRDVKDIKSISDEALNDYVPLIHISWFRDGIMPKTAKKFGLAYSYKHKRVVIPHRYWQDGRLMGFNQRTVIDNYEELGIKKYYLTPGMDKAYNLYGLYENYTDIQKAGYVVVYEAERSVLKRDSLGDSTSVALSGKNISDEQIRILRGLNVDIIFAFDKDVVKEEVWSACSKLFRLRNVYYIQDTYGILGDKDSPADAKNSDFKKLFDSKIQFNDIKYQEYKNIIKQRN